MKYLGPQVCVLAEFDGLTKSYRELHLYLRIYTQTLAFSIGLHL